MNVERTLETAETLLLVAAGGALGANLRYLVGLPFPGLGGTFLANVTGCFLLGFVLYEARHTDILAEESRTVFGTGLLSSYTTYSTFALETVQAPFVWGVGNVVASYCVGFAAVLAGRAVALRLRDAVEVRE